MGLEIEYKFLLKEIPNLSKCEEIDIFQGYLADDTNERIALRVRASNCSVPEFGKQGFITVKGPSQVERANTEFEMEIPHKYAMVLLDKCDRVLKKTRYQWHGTDGLVWEIDNFWGPLEGMWIAEVEVSSPDIIPVLPYWVGKDVTHVKAFANIKLIEMTAIPKEYYDRD